MTDSKYGSSKNIICLLIVLWKNKRMDMKMAKPINTNVNISKF